MTTPTTEAGKRNDLLAEMTRNAAMDLAYEAGAKDALAAYRRDLAERLPKALWEVGAYPEGADEGDIRRSADAVLRLIEETPE